MYGIFTYIYHRFKEVPWSIYMEFVATSTWTPRKLICLETTGSPPFRRTMWRRCYRTSWKWTMSSRNRSLGNKVHTLALALRKTRDQFFTWKSQVGENSPFLKLGLKPFGCDDFHFFEHLCGRSFWRNPLFQKKPISSCRMISPPDVFLNASASNLKGPMIDGMVGSKLL